MIDALYETSNQLVALWFVGVFVVAFLGAMAIWYAAIYKHGLAIGGSLGIVPALFFFWTGCLIWPAYAAIMFFNRKKLTAFYREILTPKQNDLQRSNHN